MSKSDFIQAYIENLRQRYDWARDETKLERLIHSAYATIHETANSWNIDGEAATAAWHAIGGKGKPTYKALRALPD